MTLIKSGNFLSYISDMGINKEGFYNECFIFDIYLLMIKNLNPFSLDRKLSNQNKHEMICMIWKECMPTNFYKNIYYKDIFLYGKMVCSQKLWKWSTKKYVYASLFPTFYIVFKAFKDQKKAEYLSEKPQKGWKKKTAKKRNGWNKQAA